jgi:transcriptional regulator with XRE-family HTH domain
MPSTVGQKTMREWREEREMTQRQVAEACGVTVGAIQGVESGRNEPHIGLALGIAQALGVPVEQIAWPIHHAQTRPRPKERPAA